MNLTDEQREQRNRLKTWMKKKGLDRQAFAEKLGYKKEYIDQVLSGRNAISETIELKLSKCYPELNVAWVMTGEGDMTLYLPDQERKPNLLSEPDVRYRSGGWLTSDVKTLIDRIAGWLEEIDSEIARLKAERKEYAERYRALMEMYERMRDKEEG